MNELAWDRLCGWPICSLSQACISSPGKWHHQLHPLSRIETWLNIYNRSKNWNIDVCVYRRVHSVPFWLLDAFTHLFSSTIFYPIQLIGIYFYVYSSFSSMVHFCRFLSFNLRGLLCFWTLYSQKNVEHPIKSSILFQRLCKDWYKREKKESWCFEYTIFDAGGYVTTSVISCQFRILVWLLILIFCPWISMEVT